MIRLIARRLLLSVLTVACIYTLTFLMVVAVPGNPFQQGQHRLAPETELALRARYHMDNNWLYFWDFLRGAVRLDFGPTFLYNDWTCNQILASALPVSILLGLLAIALSVMVGVPLGVVSASRRGGWTEKAALAAALLGVSLPSFVTGSALLILFGVYAKIAPVGGWGTLAHLPLPVVTLALPYTAYVARLTRAGMLDALSEDYIRTARAKGLPDRRVIWKHGLRSAMLPVVSYLGPAAAQAMTGSFVVEKVFGVPGMGRHFVNAALNRDPGLIMGTVLVFAALLVGLNLIVDVLYAWLDPRIREAV